MKSYPDFSIWQKEHSQTLNYMDDTVERLRIFDRIFPSGLKIKPEYSGRLLIQGLYFIQQHGS